VRIKNKTANKITRWLAKSWRTSASAPNVCMQKSGPCARAERWKCRENILRPSESVTAVFLNYFALLKVLFTQLTTIITFLTNFKFLSGKNSTIKTYELQLYIFQTIKI
jgi:hypothetical protein